MHPNSAPSVEQKRPQRAVGRLRLVMVLALALPTIGFFVISGYLYGQELRDTRQRLAFDARIAQEHALKILETNEMLLERMLDLMGDDSDDALLSRGAEIHARLRQMAAGLPQVQGLFLNGADARSLGTSRVYPPPRNIDYSDREWYRFHRDGRHRVFISDQIVSRATGEAAFDMSRRRSHRDGSFAGTVNVSLRPQYLTDFYQELGAATPGLRVALIRSDGRFVARWPDAIPARTLAAEHPLMQAFASGAREGTHDGASLLDGTNRLRTFRKLGDYPLYVVAATDHGNVVAEWLRGTGLLALLVFPTTLGFAGMTWLALKRTREELDVARRLEAETVRRQRIELALLQSQKLEAMGRLTGGVAHDFNNLLAVITNSLFVHRQLHADTADSKQLKAIERAVASGVKLTRQLLAFARKQALLLERIELQERLPALLDMLKPIAGSGIDLLCRVDDDTAPIDADAAELELALLNLTVNARDAMRGTGRLTIEARNAGPQLPDGLAGEFVVIEVTDSGPGFDPAAVEHVFEPFFTTKPVGQGTGLGLAQVQALCRSAGGIAYATAAHGGGACVRLLLRRSSRVAEAPPPEVSRVQQLRASVLLVEDNDAVAEATCQILESMGCTVVRESNGPAALSRLDSRDAAFDVVLSDIEMPGGLDGIALAELLRGRKPPLPVILVTGYAVRLEHAVRANMHVLPKPCSPAVLAQAISRATAERRAAMI